MVVWSWHFAATRSSRTSERGSSSLKSRSGFAPGIGGMSVPYRRWPKAAGVFTDMLTRATRLKASAAVELGVVQELAGNIEELIALAVRTVKGDVTRQTGNC